MDVKIKNQLNFIFSKRILFLKLYLKIKNQKLTCHPKLDLNLWFLESVLESSYSQNFYKY